MTVANVTFGVKSEMTPSKLYVRYSPESGHSSPPSQCPLGAKTGLMHRSKMSRYPITSSARMRIVGGTVTPIALAVFEVDKKFKFRGSLDRKIGGGVPFQDLVR